MYFVKAGQVNLQFLDSFIHLHIRQSPHEIKAVEVKKDESFINRVGTFECDKMIGLPFGTKVHIELSQGKQCTQQAAVD